ncbi:fibronectin type III domain-containing protein [Vallitalea okinawensis]|uniref:fibronectin type III domain-containing protein n=1 Tax=Vallitalea okinawensis TaxID=2078660 RepID=UPI001300925F|nr:cellulose binding domain-containing protein [Vallitalea okinawensis]
MKTFKAIISFVLTAIILLSSFQLLDAKKPDDSSGDELVEGDFTNRSIQIETYNAEDKQLEKKINPEFKMENTGTASIDLTELELRYFFSIEGETNISLNNFNQPLMDIEVIELENPIEGATHYLRITFDDKGDVFNPGDMETFSFRIIQEGSGSLDQTNDYSFNDSVTYAPWDKVSGYLSGYYFYGDENLFGQTSLQEWNATENQIYIKWNSIEGATGYELKMDGESTILDENQLDYTDSSLEAGTTHTYQIRPLSEYGLVGKWSEEYIIETLPDVPKNIQASSTKSTITLDWDTVNGADSYDVEVFGIPMEANTNSYTDEGLTANTQYTYRVRAKNSSGTGKWSETVAYSTLPDSSSGIWADPQTEEILVSWESVAGATLYELEVDSLLVEVNDSTSYLHQQLETNTLHTYRIRAINSYGNGPWTEYINVYTLLETPHSIQINEINSEDELNYEINWAVIEGATSYEIKIDGQVNSTTSSTVVHENIDSNSQHTYQIRAMNDDTQSNWSQEILKSSTTDAPQNLMLSINSDGLNVSWDTVIGANSYEIEINDQVTDVGLQTTYMLENINFNTTYQVRVRTLSDAGPSNWSDYTVINSSLPAPTNLRAVTSSNAIMVYWEEVEGADMYELLMDGESYMLGPRDNYTHSGLDAYSTHVYRIRAFKDGQASPWSNAITATTVVSEPDFFQVKEVTSESISLTWDNVFGASGYYIEVDGDVKNIDDNTFHHEDLKPNTLHKYRVRAYSGSGKSDWSKYIEQLTAPAIPKNLEAEATETSIILTWSIVPGADRYEVEVDGEIVDVTEEHFEHLELLPNTRHEYRVRTFNEGGASEWSELLAKNTLPSVDINVGQDNYFNFVFVVPKTGDSTRYISVYYNPDQLEVVDLCAVTPDLETETGKIDATNIEVVAHEEGYILYKISNVNKTFMNAIKFLSLTNEHATVNYEID